MIHRHVVSSNTQPVRLSNDYDHSPQFNSSALNVAHQHKQTTDYSTHYLRTKMQVQYCTIKKKLEKNAT